MKRLLRADNAALLAVALFAYHLTGGNWRLFLALILAPDLAFVGHLAGPHIGA